jgi:hypothetical protein
MLSANPKTLLTKWTSRTRSDRILSDLLIERRVDDDPISACHSHLSSRFSRFTTDIKPQFHAT